MAAGCSVGESTLAGLVVTVGSSYMTVETETAFWPCGPKYDSITDAT